MKKNILCGLLLIGTMSVGAQLPDDESDLESTELTLALDEELTLHEEKVEAAPQKMGVQDRIRSKVHATKEKRTLDKELKRQQKQERKCQQRERVACRNTNRCDQYKYKKACRDQNDKERCMLMQRWQDIAFAREEQDIAQGCYADRYNSPAWPTYMQFVECGGFVNASFNYRYATDAYSDDGSGSGDITKLAFGERPITVRDISLASALLTETPSRVSQIVPTDFDFLLDYLTTNADKKLRLFGEENRYEWAFDLARYAMGNRVLFGVQIPLVYNRHRLKANFDVFDKLDQSLLDEENTAVLRERNEFIVQPLFLRKLLAAKGMSEATNASALGLGDISFYANIHCRPTYFDRVIVGVRAQIPTAKKSTGRRLWEPELGNGGFARFDGFVAALLAYNRRINPHLMIQVTANMPAHVNRRVPHIVSIDNANSATTKQLAAHNFAFADHLYLNSDTSIDDYDSTIRGFSDQVTNIKIRPGAQVQLRVGNVSECVLARRGTFDLYYDFRAKEANKVCGGLDEASYDVPSITQYTYELEHRLGGEYAYQFDHDTRLRLGAIWTFAGQNVAKTIELSAQFNYAF